MYRVNKSEQKWRDFVKKEHGWMVYKSPKDGFIEVMCSNCKRTLDRRSRIPDACPYCGMRMVDKKDMN